MDANLAKENTSINETSVKPKDSSKPRAQMHKEGEIAKAIEEETAKLPSDLFLYSATLSIIGSCALYLFKRKSMALFVGQWVPTFLLLGTYNKLVKVMGSDQTEEGKGETFH